MIRVALAGVGNIAQVHIPAWLAQEDTQLCALCDIRPEKMAAWPDLRSYTDWKDMLLAERPDILDICLPTDLHARVAAFALGEGIHVLSEKPLSLRPEDADLVGSAARAHGCLFMVAQVLRFWPAYEYLRGCVRDGRYGRLVSGFMTRVSAQPAWSQDSWMRDAARSGLVPFDLHIHDLDFLVSLLGLPTQKTVRRRTSDRQDSLSVIYDFGGVPVTCVSAWYHGGYPFEAEHLFELEEAVISFRQGRCMVSEPDGKRFFPLEEEGALARLGLPSEDAYANEIRYFTDCVRTGTPPARVPLEQVREVIGLLSDTGEQKGGQHG